MNAQAHKNNRIGVLALAGAFGMAGMAYASVPLYKMFCQVTGFGGTPMWSDQIPQVILKNKVTVRFDANTDAGLPWRFSPVMGQDTIKIGQNAMAFYTAENMSDKPITGTATFNVSPDIAGQYFSKVQCFCFTEQVLQPGEKITLPVSYFVDPKIMDDKYARNIKEITLSYTFYRSEDGVAQTPILTTQNKVTLPVAASVR
jgi:cytochrome c oxidase assembly protein subunit 11